VTCHLVPWDWGHALRNLLALLAPFALVEKRGRLAAVILVIAPLLSLALLPTLKGGTYGGASGLASAAWAFAGVVLLAAGHRIPGLALLGLLFAKIVAEEVTGTSLFAISANWRNLPAAHLFGALLGLAAAVVEVVLSRKRRLRARRATPGT
jgi:membrane associated rhomboid family serine protease